MKNLQKPATRFDFRATCRQLMPTMIPIPTRCPHDAAWGFRKKRSSVGVRDAGRGAVKPAFLPIPTTIPTSFMVACIKSSSCPRRYISLPISEKRRENETSLSDGLLKRPAGAPETCWETTIQTPAPTSPNAFPASRRPAHPHDTHTSAISENPNKNALLLRGNMWVSSGHHKTPCIAKILGFLSCIAVDLQQLTTFFRFASPFAKTLVPM